MATGSEQGSATGTTTPMAEPWAGGGVGIPTGARTAPCTAAVVGAGSRDGVEVVTQARTPPGLTRGSG